MIKLKLKNIFYGCSAAVVAAMPSGLISPQSGCTGVCGSCGGACVSGIVACGGLVACYLYKRGRHGKAHVKELCEQIEE